MVVVFDVKSVTVPPAGFSVMVVPGLNVPAFVPVALYAWLNTKKFGTLFSVPYDHQLLNRLQKNRLEVLAANHNSLFRIDAIPTALYQYFRPDAIGFRSEFPWVQFPTWRPSVFGGLLYDHRDRTSSIPASMPLLLGLALIGLVAVVVAHRRDNGATLAALRVPAIGAAVAVLPSLAFIFLTQRYLGDAVPVLVLLGLTGLFAALAWLARGGSDRRVVAAVAAVALVAIGVFGVLANFGMARDWQRDHLPAAQQFPADRR